VIKILDTKMMCINIKRVIGFTLLLTLVVFGCETERVVFQGPYFIRFTESTAFARESESKPIQVEVHQAGPALSEDVTVNYLIGGNAREGVDYTIVGTRGRVVIPKGKYFGYITIQLINNSNNILRSQNIIFTLTSSETNTLQIGQGESAIGKSFTFTIFDDCILGGNYKGSRNIFSVPVENISITSEDCEHYTLSNWNINIFNSPFEFPLTFIDKGDNTLEIPSQEQGNLPEDLATITGTGVVDPITREINMTIKLVDFDDQPEISFTLLPD
jgi:hypothetical protein